MQQIRKNLWLSSWQPASNLPVLRACGITAILNVAQDINDRDVGIPCFKVGLTDGPHNLHTMKMMAVDLLQELMTSEVVLVHCIAGRSRSPWVAAMALSELERCTYDDIYEEIRKHRPEVLAKSLLDDRKV